MLVFWDQKLVFLATPKAGSTAIQAALEPLASMATNRPEPLKHMSAQDFHSHLAPFLQGRADAPFTTLALIREPMTWLRSYYRFLSRDRFEDDPALRGLSFEQFVLDYIRPDPPAHAAIGTQSDFLCAASGDCLVDNLFRYEEMETFIAFLEDRLHFEIRLPLMNVSPEANTDLSPETEARLRTHLQGDFALYDSLS